MKTCAECKHYNKPGKEDGECRRFPPALDKQGRPAFPLVKADCWCGEYAEPRLKL